MSGKYDDATQKIDFESIPNHNKEEKVAGYQEFWNTCFADAGYKKSLVPLVLTKTKNNTSLKQ